MAAGAWVFTNNSLNKFNEGAFLTSDSYKIGLFLSTSNIGASSTTYAGVTNEHANSFGYTTGGNAVTLSKSGTSTITFDATDPAVWTASGGSIVARFAVLYEVSGDVLAYCLLESPAADVTVTTGNTLTLTINASGVFTHTQA
jgi:hypothetical protein